MVTAQIDGSKVLREAGIELLATKFMNGEKIILSMPNTGPNRMRKLGELVAKKNAAELNINNWLVPLVTVEGIPRTGVSTKASVACMYLTEYFSDFEREQLKATAIRGTPVGFYLTRAGRLSETKDGCLFEEDAGERDVAVQLPDSLGTIGILPPGSLRASEQWVSGLLAKTHRG